MAGEGTLSVIEMLGNTITALRQQLEAAQVENENLKKVLALQQTPVRIEDLRPAASVPNDQSSH